MLVGEPSTEQTRIQTPRFAVLAFAVEAETATGYRAKLPARPGPSLGIEVGRRSPTGHRNGDRGGGWGGLSYWLLILGRWQASTRIACAGSRKRLATGRFL